MFDSFSYYQAIIAIFYGSTSFISLLQNYDLQDELKEQTRKYMLLFSYVYILQHKFF